jgi:hypothetical protein
MAAMISRLHFSSSSPRKRESRSGLPAILEEIPAFAGMTTEEMAVQFNGYLPC